ncbi:hypothetical protein HYC85_028987 [Camellia sinensis]|uniref:Uncharacterized protein n=1 Tax=Camellia sinensis TaxID=4442 RepID=A0A7J7G0N7_CAMSI|nr:hypothetical protein HYC85_028987 [Camellia sinensis]
MSMASQEHLDKMQLRQNYYNLWHIDLSFTHLSLSPPISSTTFTTTVNVIPLPPLLPLHLYNYHYYHHRHRSTTTTTTIATTTTTITSPPPPPLHLLYHYHNFTTNFLHHHHHHHHYLLSTTFITVAAPSLPP